MKQELRQLQALRLEARKLKRESEALDLVVHRFVSMPASLPSLPLSLATSSIDMYNNDVGKESAQNS